MRLYCVICTCRKMNELQKIRTCIRRNRIRFTLYIIPLIVRVILYYYKLLALSCMGQDAWDKKENRLKIKGKNILFYLTKLPSILRKGRSEGLSPRCNNTTPRVYIHPSMLTIASHLPSLGFVPCAILSYFSPESDRAISNSIIYVYTD